MSFPGSSDGKESACNAWDVGLNPGLGRFSWRRERQPTPVFLPGESSWTEEPDRLQSMGLQRVGHDWVTFTFILSLSLGLPLMAVWKIRLSWWLRWWLCPDLITGSRKSPGEGNGYSLQYSCLENSMNRGAWWDTVHGVEKQSDTTEQLTLSHVVKDTQKILDKILLKNF